jgi:hypothetical protein
MNYLKTIALCLALVVSQLATADIKHITVASEVRLSDFRAPASVNGIASFKDCESCQLQNVSVTKNTRYEINNQVVTLQDFRKSLSTVTNRDRIAVTVIRHLESDVVTLISTNL